MEGPSHTKFCPKSLACQSLTHKGEIDCTIQKRAYRVPKCQKEVRSLLLLHEKIWSFLGINSVVCQLHHWSWDFSQWEVWLGSSCRAWFHLKNSTTRFCSKRLCGASLYRGGTLNCAKFCRWCTEPSEDSTHSIWDGGVGFRHPWNHTPWIFNHHIQKCRDTSKSNTPVLP